MNTYFNENNLVIKYTDYQQFIYNSSLLKQYFNCENNLNKKKIIINLDNCIIIDSIDDQVLFINILQSFYSLLKMQNLSISKINISNLLVIHNNTNKQYYILGVSLTRQQTDFYSIINRDTGLTLGINHSNVSFLVFSPSLDIDKIDNYVYSKKVSFVISENIDTKNYSIKIMKKKFSKYLTNTINFIRKNKNEIINVDYILVSKNNIDLSILDNKIINSIKNYLIIGNKTTKNLMNNAFSKIIKELYNSNKTGIKDIDITKIYSSYDLIIFRSKFLISIIDEINEYGIEELSIILSYFDKI